MFTDKKDRAWDFAFTCADLFRVEEQTSVDLSDVEAVIDVLGKPRKFLQVCYSLGKAEARDLDFDSFCQGFDGDTIEKAQAELWRAIELFSPSGRRALVADLAAKIQAHTKAAIAEAGERLKLSGNLPGESESIQGPLLSDR